jgi:hypothetical protein
MKFISFFFFFVPAKLFRFPYYHFIIKYTLKHEYGVLFYNGSIFFFITGFINSIKILLGSFKTKHAPSSVLVILQNLGKV